MPHLHYDSPYGNHLPSICLLLLGVGLFVLATVYACTGEAWTRGGGYYNRSTTPVKFWLAVALYYCLGAFAIVTVFH